MAEIFISYRSADSYHSAPLIYEGLVKVFGKAKVFLDKGTMGAGEDFEKAVWPALRESRVFVIVIGPDWVGENLHDGTRRIDDPEDYPRREVRLALERRERGDLLILPVTVNGAKHEKFDLPDDIKGLKPINAQPFGDWYTDDLKILVGNVKQRVKPLPSSKTGKKKGRPGRSAPPAGRNITITTGGGDVKGNIISTGDVNDSAANEREDEDDE